MYVEVYTIHVVLIITLGCIVKTRGITFTLNKNWKMEKLMILSGTQLRFLYTSISSMHYCTYMCS